MAARRAKGWSAAGVDPGVGDNNKSILRDKTLLRRGANVNGDEAVDIFFALPYGFGKINFL